MVRCKAQAALTRRMPAMPFPSPLPGKTQWDKGREHKAHRRPDGIWWKRGVHNREKAEARSLFFLNWCHFNFLLFTKVLVFQFHEDNVVWEAGGGRGI